jgi:hypothetical protein
VVTHTVFVLTLDAGKFGTQDKDCPDQGNRADDQIGFYHPERFCLQVSLVQALRLASRYLLWRQFDA